MRITVFFIGLCSLLLSSFYQTVAQAQTVSLELQPRNWGTSYRFKERTPPLSIPSGGIGPISIEPPQLGRVGFVRTKLGSKREWQVSMYRTAVFFSFDALPQPTLVTSATLTYREVDTTELNQPIRKGGSPCLSAVDKIRMLNQAGFHSWQRGRVKKFAETKGFTLTQPNTSGVNREIDVTRFVQNAFANQSLYNDGIGLILSGHRERFPKRVKSSRQCTSDIYDVSLKINFIRP